MRSRVLSFNHSSTLNYWTLFLFLLLMKKTQINVEITANRFYFSINTFELFLKSKYNYGPSNIDYNVSIEKQKEIISNVSIYF